VKAGTAFLALFGFGSAFAAMYVAMHELTSYDPRSHPDLRGPGTDRARRQLSPTGRTYFNAWRRHYLNMYGHTPSRMEVEKWIAAHGGRYA
jgi:hypothetical protein